MSNDEITKDQYWSLYMEVQCYQRDRVLAFRQRDAMKALLLEKITEPGERDAIEQEFYGGLADREVLSWSGFRTRRESLLKLLAKAAEMGRGSDRDYGAIAQDIYDSLDPTTPEWPTRP